MKISYARLRSGVNYKGPLRNIIDSFCELHKMFIERNPKHQYGYYNFGFNKANRRKLDDIPDSDVVIIPSENEFHYHIKSHLLLAVSLNLKIVFSFICFFPCTIC